MNKESDANLTRFRICNIHTRIRIRKERIQERYSYLEILVTENANNDFRTTNHKNPNSTNAKFITLQKVLDIHLYLQLFSLSLSLSLSPLFSDQSNANPFLANPKSSLPSFSLFLLKSSLFFNKSHTSFFKLILLKQYSDYKYKNKLIQTNLIITH